MTPNKFYFKISIQIILIFGAVILISFIPDYLHSFFGDAFCDGNITKDMCSDGWDMGTAKHGPSYHWGYRHWVWFCMGLSLFVVQVVRLIELINYSDVNDKTN